MFGCSSACGEVGTTLASTQNARDSAGIRIVEAAADDRPLDWQFTEELRLGSADDGPTGFYQIDERSIAVGQSGSTYVLDKGNKWIVVFDARGEYQRTVGRPGDGPGELRYPVNIWVRAGPAGDEIEVLDFAHGKIVRFTAEGGLLGEEDLVVMGMTEDLARSAEGWVWGGGEGYRSTSADSVTDFVALAAGRDTTWLASTRSRRPKRVFYEECNFWIAQAPLFRLRLVWDAMGDTVVLAAGKKYQVARFVAGQLKSLVRRPLPPFQVSEEEAAASAELVWDEPGNRCRIDGETVLANRGYDEQLQVVADVAISPTGETWVRRNQMGGAVGPIDVFDESDTYLGTLPTDVPFPVAFASTGDVVVIERDELDVPYVVRYAIQRLDE